MSYFAHDDYKASIYGHARNLCTCQMQLMCIIFLLFIDLLVYHVSRDDIDDTDGIPAKDV